METQSYTQKNGLMVKDFVTIGIFSALLLVTMLIGGLPFAPNPVVTFYMPLGSALLGGSIFLLLVAKVPKRGAGAAVLCAESFLGRRDDRNEGEENKFCITPAYMGR